MDTDTLGVPGECIQVISTVEDFRRIPDFGPIGGPILLLIPYGGPGECIEGKISTVEGFCGIPDLKTRILQF